MTQARHGQTDSTAAQQQACGCPRREEAWKNAEILILRHQLTAMTPAARVSDNTPSHVCPVLTESALASSSRTSTPFFYYSGR
jgi:hypothetical protein